MHQLLADSQSELAHLVSVLGETSAISRLEKHSGSLKEQLAAIDPTLAELRKKRDERLKQFKDVEEQIQRISSEIAGNISESHHTSSFDEQDLSLKNLDEFHVQLQGLHREKNERLQKVLDYVDAMHTLSRVMGLEFSKVISEVHPSLARSQRDYSKSINDVILSKLASRVESLLKEKEGRLRKIQKLGTTLLELWNLIGTSLEEQISFDHISRYVFSSVAEITMPRALSLEINDQDNTIMTGNWYVVFVGRQVGVYGTWAECEQQIMGFSNPKYRNFKTLKEASDHYNEFLRTGEVPRPKLQNVTRHGKFEEDDGSSSQPRHPREIATSTHHPPPPCPLHYSMPMNVTLHVSPCNVFEQMLLYAIAVLIVALLLKHVLFIW